MAGITGLQGQGSPIKSGMTTGCRGFVDSLTGGWLASYPDLRVFALKNIAKKSIGTRPRGQFRP